MCSVDYYCFLMNDCCCVEWSFLIGMSSGFHNDCHRKQGSNYCLVDGGKRSGFHNDYYRKQGSNCFLVDGSKRSGCYNDYYRKQDNKCFLAVESNSVHKQSHWVLYNNVLGSNC